MSSHQSKIIQRFAALDLENSDAGLVKRCRKGEQSAWDELVGRYQRLIFAIPRRAGLSEEQAADVFQEVFLTLFEKIDAIEQPEKIRSWMVTTAKFKTWGIVRGEKGFYAPLTEEEMDAEMAGIHELAHLAEPYHSAKFWLIVQSHCPRYEEYKAWLKDNEDRMRLPD